MTREELQAKLAAAKAATAAVAPNDDEREMAALHEQIAAEEEQKAVHEAMRRELDLRTREDAAREAAGGRYLVQGVDLVALFPPGKAPMDKLPSKGVIIVKNPDPERENALTREVEHKKRDLNPILLDLLTASTVDPAPDSPEHLKLQLWGQAFPAAATQAAGVARQLGGAKAREDKRGRG